MTVTASAISGILAKGGFKRANRRGTSWSSGFEVTQYGEHVRIDYTAVNTDQAMKVLHQMADTLNHREGGKYWAKVVERTYGWIVEVFPYDETDPQQNEERKAMAQEKLAADHPAAPAIADVKKALRTYSQYDADVYGNFGTYKVERLEEDGRLVRVRLVESPNATYEGDRDDHIARTLANFARVVKEAGFEFQVRDDEMSVIVGMAGEWDNALTPETVTTVLRSAYTPYSTKTGGFDVVNEKLGVALRVNHYDGIGQDEKVLHDIVESYGRMLVKTGYDVVVDYQDAWSLLVTQGVPQEPEESQEAVQASESDRQVREALLALREAVEYDSPLVSTRRAGDNSIFVMAINLSVEVTYGNGQYASVGSGRRRNQGLRTFPAVNSELLDFIRDELGV